MKVSSVRTDRKNQQRVKTYDLELFLNRIQTDANHALINEFRHSYQPDKPERFHRYKEIAHIFANVHLRRQQNGALGVVTYNGLVVLEVRQVMSEDSREALKRAAMEMPSTLAAFVGATGTEVILLVRVARADGSQPATEIDAEAFYPLAYRRMARIYDAALPIRVTRMTPTLRHSFLMPLDPHPLVNNNAVPYRIAMAAADEADNNDAHLLALPEKRDATEVDMTAYLNYERAYRIASDAVQDSLGKSSHSDTGWLKDYITGMATELCKTDWPEEETVCHLWRHLMWKDVPGLNETFVRTIVEAVYQEDDSKQHRRAKGIEEPLMQQIIRRMESRYAFRFNQVMGYTEYRANHTWVTPWMPITDKVINTFTTDLQLSGLNVWDRDVRRFIHSTRIRDFDPIDDYLFTRCRNWDGRDHIRALAATVPTKNAEQWADWFHTWFLAMVAQWQGRDRRYGNAIVPLLISAQGMHKSSFCRQLLPPELRSWGYSDNLSLSEERPVHLAMSQMLLINLDEFNRISPAKQQGFLKNILQLPSVKVKRPYASHTEEVPRLASFIATTNMADVLHDPTGSRRFIGIEVTGSIDVSMTPNHEQLYAQACAELEKGARYWFDDDETAVIMEHNRQFQLQSTPEQFFHEFFEAASPAEGGGEWLTPTAIAMEIKKRAGSLFQPPAITSFGRRLANVPEIVAKRANVGRVYYVKRRK